MIARTPLDSALSARTASAISPRSRDRKSTRLNSSHEWISYAGFCLKQKNKQPLRSVLDTTNSWALGGRLLAYGDRDVTLVWRPGMRKRTTPPLPEATNHIVLALSKA